MFMMLKGICAALKATCGMTSSYIKLYQDPFREEV